MFKDNNIPLRNRFSVLSDEQIDNSLYFGDAADDRISVSDQMASTDSVVTMRARGKRRSNGNERRPTVVINKNPESDTIERTFPKHKHGSRSVTIIGDSIIRDIKSHKMRQALGTGDKIFLKTFSGATNQCMKSYIIPSQKFKSDLYILHTGTNNMSSGKNDIFNLANDLKTETNNVIISGIISRNDKLNEMVKQVNYLLNKLCIGKDIYFLDNGNIPTHFLNASGLHLNFNGTTALADNFLKCIRM